MPPWHIDKTVGIQKFKNDRSLSDEQIDTIVAVGRGRRAEGRSEGHAAGEGVARRNEAWHLADEVRRARSRS